MSKPQIILERFEPAKPWWLLEKIVTVLHGTSEVHLPEILRQGLKPCNDSLEEQTKEILRYYVNEPDAALVKQVIERSATGSIRSSQSVKKAQLFFTLYPSSGASFYAEWNAPDGGEYARDVRETLEKILDKKFVPRFVQSRPVLLALDIPSSTLGEAYTADSMAVGAMNLKDCASYESYLKYARLSTNSVGGLGGEVSARVTISPESIKRIVAAERSATGDWVFPPVVGPEDSARDLYDWAKERIAEKGKQAESTPERPPARKAACFSSAPDC